MSILMRYGPTEWTLPLVLLAIVVIVHHLSRAKPIWLWVTGVTGSVLAGWLADTLDLGWFAAKFFGSTSNAAFAYAALGIAWLTAEVGYDLVVNVKPRYRDFWKDWDQKRQSDGRHLTAEMKRLEFNAAVDDWNAKHPRDLIIRPDSYQWSRSRRWWFLAWFICWPVFVTDFIVWLLRQGPWEWLSWLMPFIVAVVKKPFLGDMPRFSDDPPIERYGGRQDDVAGDNVAAPMLDTTIPRAEQRTADT